MAKQNLENWGRSTAKSRYGSASAGRPADDCCQAPQFPEDKHGPKYDNDVTGWPDAKGSQTPYPNFDGRKK